jgi:hypothetical protein
MEHTPEQSAQSPEIAYRQNYTEICKLMLSINNKLYAQANDGQPKNWSQIGDQGHVIEVLHELTTFLGIQP